MASRVIQQRTRFFFAVEGESEQSFIKWLNDLSADKNHLDTYLLGGGGYSSMLPKAAKEHKRRVKKDKAYKNQFLLIDSDRASTGDWSIEKLRQEVAKEKLGLYLQQPIFEVLLLRLMPNMENRNPPDSASTMTQLRALWPDYKKPVDARTLGQRFTLQDLLRVANVNNDLRALLQLINLM